MTKEKQCKLLEKNGWTIICESPFEIEKWENGSCVAEVKGQAVFTIAYYLEKDNKLPGTITTDDLSSKYEHHLTIGLLKKLINDYNLPDDGKILVERVHDCYFERNGWDVFYKEGDSYNDAIKFNEKIDGEFNNKDEYPDLDVSKLKKYSLSDLQYTKEQYHPAWYASKCDGKNLCIHLHY